MRRTLALLAAAVLLAAGAVTATAVTEAHAAHGVKITTRAHGV